MTEHQASYLLLYTGVVAFAILLIAVAVIVLALAAAKLLKQIGELTAEAKGKVYPILESVRDISEKGQHIAEVARNVVADTEPKIKRVTANIADTSDVYRAKVAQVDHFITDTTEKAHKQSDRVDQMISGALTRTTEAASSLQHAVTSPFVKAAGFLSGAKAGIETLLQSSGSSTGRSRAPKPVAFEGESVYTGYEDDYHA